MAPFAPRTRAVAAIRMKQIALDNQSRMNRRLRAQLATERRVSAVIREELDKRAVNMSQELELVLKDNRGLRNSWRLCQDREKSLYKDTDRYIAQLADANSQNKEDKEKLETSQATIVQLSTVSYHLEIQAQNHQAQWQNVEEEFRQYLLQADTKIRLLDNDVRTLIHENANMLDAMQAMHEEELEEDLVEAEGAERSSQPVGIYSST
ncbi:peroxisomal biogenesis factor 6-like [Dorcoceras hygrometricum]|uniref:Peroxisomal biogenesis factor 6-like n=1 Tax=Dorcoceras hygrometricum TaxID=472368 RepID=A0A2Z7C498_9LAMI|nr:peroxisomal biogenesis factor 6-like [Dorcoceras hygrometricum]